MITVRTFNGLLFRSSFIYDAVKRKYIGKNVSSEVLLVLLIIALYMNLKLVVAGEQESSDDS